MIYQVFKCQWWCVQCVLNKKFKLRNNISLEKDKCYVITSARPDKNYCQIQDLKNFVPIYIMHQTSFWRPQYYARRRLYRNNLERNEFKVYISLEGNKLTCFANSRLISGTWFSSRFLKKVSHGMKKYHSWKKIMQLLWKVVTCLLKYV